MLVHIAEIWTQSFYCIMKIRVSTVIKFLSIDIILSFLDQGVVSKCNLCGMSQWHSQQR